MVVKTPGVVLVFLWSVIAASSGTASETIPENAGISSGLSVCIGSESSAIPTQLAQSQKMLVHVLGLNQASVDRIRQELLRQRLYGLVSAETPLDWTALPYADNMVNLLVVENFTELSRQGLTATEICRVLAPMGVVCVAGPDASKEFSATALQPHLERKGFAKVALTTGDEGPFSLFRKTEAVGSDTWTHWCHGADGNAVSNDVNVKPPTHLRWTSGTETIGAKTGNYTGVRAWNGLMFYGHQREDKTGTDLVARDAYNGTRKWIRSGVVKANGGWIPLVVENGKVFTIASGTGPVVALDAATGANFKTYSELTWTKFTGYPHSLSNLSLLVCDSKLLLGARNLLRAVDPTSGTELWRFDAGASKFVHFVSASREANAVFLVISGNEVPWGCFRWPSTVNEAIVCLKLTDGTVRWKTTTAAGRNVGQLVYHKGNLGLFASNQILGVECKKGARPVVGVLDAATGNRRWIQDACLPGNGGYNMYMLDSCLYLSQGGHMTEYKVTTGAWRHWNYRGLESGINQRCARGFATVKYLATGYVTWLDRNFNYEFKPIRRSGCAMSGYPAYGQVYFTPATCGCFPELDGGKGYVSLSTSGSRKVVSDDWRLVPSGTTNWDRSGTPTSVIRKAATGSPLDFDGPIVGDWPDYRRGTGAAKRTGGETWTSGDFEFRNTGSLMSIELYRSGVHVSTLLTGGRISAKPVVFGSAVIVGSHDGWVYSYSLPEGNMQWRFLAAPYDHRVIVASQLESTWPVTSISLEENVLHVDAGRHLSLAGGIFKYDIDARTGAILRKQREFAPGDGALSSPEKGYSLYEEIPSGREPQFETPYPRAPQVVAHNTTSTPLILVQRTQIRVEFSAARATEAELRVSDLRGRILLQSKGSFAGPVVLPFEKMRMGSYVVTCRAGEKSATARFQVTHR